MKCDLHQFIPCHEISSSTERLTGFPDDTWAGIGQQGEDIGDSGFHIQACQPLNADHSPRGEFMLQQTPKETFVSLRSRFRQSLQCR